MSSTTTNTTAGNTRAALPIRVGVIGCGLVAGLHVQRLRGDPRVEIACWCDPDLDRARALAESVASKAPVARDVREVADAVKLAALVICSPTQLHFEQSMWGFDRGLHVLCEKPLAPTRSECVALVARAREAGKILSVSYQRRYQAPHRSARRELQERGDRYGPLRRIHVFVCERWEQTIRGTWRDDPAVGAGYFGDAGSHQIDACWFIAESRPLRVLAQSSKRQSQVEIVTSVTADLEGGAGLSAHFVGDAHHWREDIHFHCTKADLLLRQEKLFRCHENRIEPIEDLVEASSPDREFIDAILARRPTASPGECGIVMALWTWAVLASIETGTWVECSRDAPSMDRSSLNK